MMPRLDGPTESTPSIPGLALHWATRASFFIAGFGISAWAPLIPFAKARLHLTDPQLGGLLLCLGTGSVIGMPLAGGLVGRVGLRRIILATAFVSVAMLPLLATATHVVVMAAALAVFGAAIGSLDVVMNVHAGLVERLSGRPMMSGFHGLYSAGGMVGAVSVSGLISAGLSPTGATVVVVAALVALLAVTGPSLLPGGGEAGGPSFALPHGPVLLLGAVCFVLFLAEGSVLDWSAVLLTSLRHMPTARAGLGYAAFSTLMTLCRLFGDSIVIKLGPRRVMLLGSLCAAGGFALAVLVPSAATGVIGFGLVGMGASNVVPVMFSAAGRQSAMPPHLAVAAITTMGYAGILLGPAMVGFVAGVAGLPAGLLVVAAMLVGVAGVSRRVRI